MGTTVALCYRHPRLVFAIVYMSRPYTDVELPNLESRAGYQAGIYGITGRLVKYINPIDPELQAFAVILEPVVKITDEVMEQFLSAVFSKGGLAVKWEKRHQKIGAALEVVLALIS